MILHIGTGGWIVVSYQQILNIVVSYVGLDDLVVFCGLITHLDQDFVVMEQLLNLRIMSIILMILMILIYHE